MSYKMQLSFPSIPWRILLTLPIVVVLFGSILTALAQQENPIERIEITYVEKTLQGPSEDNLFYGCALWWEVSWPVYGSRTNASDYVWHFPGTPGTPQLIEANPPVGGRFVVRVSGAGAQGGNTPEAAASCEVFKDDVRSKAPDWGEWWVELEKLPPVAAFDSSVSPDDPKLTTFEAKSTDPEGFAISHAWEFGDESSGGGDKPTHRYTKPGFFEVALTATDNDGLTNLVSKIVSVLAPTVQVSLDLLSKRSRNRIEPGEEFQARVKVSVSSSGVGELKELAFVGPALTIPENQFTVISPPANLSIGTMQPGEEREYLWMLRADGFGDFSLQTASVTGKDAIDRPKEAPGAVTNGTITALIVEMRQQPERVVIGEDNNGDGTIDELDDRVEIVVSVANVSQVAVADVATADPAAPIQFTSLIPDTTIYLKPMLLPSAQFGTIQPGAANAVVRTNVYETEDFYVLATAKTELIGDMNGVTAKGSAETTVSAAWPFVDISMRALESSGLSQASINAGLNDIDAPLVPTTAVQLLSNQPEVTKGLMADGVTPLLFILEGDTGALQVQEDEMDIKLEMKVRLGGRVAGDVDLTDRIRVRKDTGWVKSATATLTRTIPKVYVYLTPIDSDDIEFEGGNDQLWVQLRVLTDDSGVLIEEKEFNIAKPLVTFVHGYFTEGDWGGEFVQVVGRTRAVVKTIKYGQTVSRYGTPLPLILQHAGGLPSLKYNTLKPLEYLADDLSDQLENVSLDTKEQWAFTRHDVIAHSQGGLLTRMLSSRNRNDWVDQPFKNEMNHFRGRFHRVVTIGSPHNGTRFLRYLLTLREAGALLTPGGFKLGGVLPKFGAWGAVVGEIAQDKFDPWGEQIVNLNNPSPSSPWHPDSDAKFHLVRTTVAGGVSPSPQRRTWAHYVLGLADPLIGEIVLPRGSDGIVDFESMATVSAGETPQPNVYTIANGYDISHAVTGLPGIPDVFGGNNGGQTGSPIVAEHVIAALDQNSAVPSSHIGFGPFRVPKLLPESIRHAIDLAARSQSEWFVTLDLSEVESINNPGLQSLSVAALETPRVFDLSIKPSTGLPPANQEVYWFAEVFGTNGVSTEGLELLINESDPMRATLTIDSEVLGDVVVYSVYQTLDNRPVFSNPLRVASFEPDSDAVEMLATPQGLSVPVGGGIPVQVFVEYEDGTVLQRHIEAGELTVSSSTPGTVEVSDPLYWSFPSSGTASVTATWRGLTSEGDVTVQGHRQGSLPVADPLVWLKADAGVEHEIGEGGKVTRWTDQSRNNFVFAPEDFPWIIPPVYAEDAVNGLPAVRFIDTITPLVGNLDRSLTEATIFTLCRFDEGRSGMVYAFGTRDFSGLAMSVGQQGAAHTAVHYDGAVYWTKPNTFGGSDFKLLSQTYGGEHPDHQRLILNSEVVFDTYTTTGRSYSGLATKVVIGSNIINNGYNFEGDLVEWLVYDRVLSDEERLEVEEYLRQRAGLEPVFDAASQDLTDAEMLQFDTSEGPEGHWMLDTANRNLKLADSGDPSMALIQGETSDGVIKMTLSSTGDSGSMGVVFGYVDPGSFYLFDWRQAEEEDVEWGTAPAGMRLRSFQLPEGMEPSGSDFWSGTESDTIATVRSSDIPWGAGTEYEIVLHLNADGTVIEINEGETNLVTWDIPELAGVEGSFGPYAHLASDVEFGSVVFPGAAPIITGIEPTTDGGWTVRWANGLSPYVLEGVSDLTNGAWEPLAPATPNQSRTIYAQDDVMLFRIRSAGVRE